MRLFSVILFIVNIGLITGTSHCVSIPKYMEDCMVLIEDAQIAHNDTFFVVRGTGFLFFDGNENNPVYLISNRHVFMNRDNIFVKLNLADGSSVRKPVRLRDNVGNYFWTGHPDSSIDLALTRVTYGLNVRYISKDRIKPIDEIELGDEVLFLGFPLLGFASTNKNYPITRHGIVSFVAQENIGGLILPDSILLSKNMMLIDATVLPGNSGSPVLSTPRKGSDKTSLIGVVRGHISSLISDENLDFGIVIPAYRIIELINFITKE